ncbi:MAG: bifunctional phosphoribosylaminoimidazolecarboxamide formyltransferase/IMP cyclohydrolase [Planctomycetota bacterium]|jgi:phosphoribosylaminoimidazolecarboxamide formyltransferase/IMP cyclohydrolase|nr:bifunctional phosphoribosylaminoimidazolecarboxamide formyltransferase/IMP cyclohydrolase [Planctomycetota bacterium]
MQSDAPPPAPPPDLLPIRRVLVSVFDKTGLHRLAAALAAAGVEVVSTGGTARALASHGLEVVDISAVTGFPEVLDGRVKTLHPNVFAGILARADRPDDMAVLAEHGIGRFDAVVVNLYAFEEAVARPGCLPHEAIELIDIGGPSLVRAAAKNHAYTAIVTGPEQYDDLIAAVGNGGMTLSQRKLLAARAFERTAAYDAVIARWMARHAGLVAGPEGAAGPIAAADPDDEPPLPARMSLEIEQRKPLRYGENPHQSAALFAPLGTHVGLAGLRQLAGKELSYNNLLDLDAATRLAGLLQDPGAVVIKHTNPCGAASATTAAAALADAMAADPTSAFGSIVAVNRTFDLASAEVLTAPGLFVEVIAAPAFDPAAVDLLTTKPTWKASVRLVEMPPGDPWEPTAGLELRSVAGGFLAQRPDEDCDDPAAWQVVTKAAPPASLTPALDFAFTVVRRLTSNAIAVCAGTSLVGAGSGQTSRVDAVRIALEKAGERARGGVLASDAFFPFPDSIELIARAGVAAIVQPGGSKRDGEVIAAADAAGIPMVFTLRRHFRH